MVNDMEEFINNIVNTLVGILSSLGIFSGFLLVFLESIIPIVPLSVFVALNIITFGSITGIIISWLGTICGCSLSFFISRKLANAVEKKYKNNKKLMSIRKRINNISFTSLTVLVAIPFTPAFAVNIASGLSEMKFKKFIFAMAIGKIPMIYFWGFIGKSLLESMTDISVLSKIAFMLILAYLVSKLANKYIKE